MDATQPLLDGKTQEVYRIASELFRQDPDWVTFFREVLGVEGVVRRVCNTQEELIALERTVEYQEIRQMLAKLRERSGGGNDPREPTRVITVRLPKSVHESLRAEASDRKTSMNKLCISKLLQVVGDQMISQKSP
jgi:predicted HicB family RNase H-like nuclease